MSNQVSFAAAAAPLHAARGGARARPRPSTRTLIVCALVALAGGAGAPTATERRGPGLRGPTAGAVALTAAPPQTVVLTLPFEGIWGVVQGMDSGDTHTGYAAFAVDFVPAEKLEGALPEKARRRLTDFPCYGQAVVAPADGKVLWARDGAPDHPPHNRIKRDPGNFVIVEHAPAELTEFRHLRAGSLRVRVGERVKRGQIVAECGNSGNAHTPHLHVGFLGSVDPIATRPMLFSGYETLQKDGSWRAGDGMLAPGQILRRAATLPPAGATRKQNPR